MDNYYYYYNLIMLFYWCCHTDKTHEHGEDRGSMKLFRLVGGEFTMPKLVISSKGEVCKWIILYYFFHALL